MRRVLLLSSEFPPGPGGIGTHAWQFARLMAGLGWEVCVLTSQDYLMSGEIQDFNSEQSFSIYQLGRKESWVGTLFDRFRKLREIIRNWKPDVMVVTGDHLVWLVSVAYYISAFPRRLPWISIWHGVEPRQALKKHMSAWAFSQSDLTVAVSQYSLGKLMQMGASPRRSKVINNGADESSYKSDPALGLQFRKEYGLPSDAALLLTVGNMSERKGQDIVIRALPNILTTYPHLHYLVVGLPTSQPELECLSNELQVRSQVHFLGRLSHKKLQAVYNACDIFVLVSRHDSNGQFEGYGIAVIEAALCAKPAIVADNSGLVEAVQDGQTGLVVPENDPYATGQAIQFLLENPSLRLQMGEYTRRRALAGQTWLHAVQEYDVEINNLIMSNKEQ